jgi:hypothetical protein
VQNTDNNGNYISDIGVVAGNSTTLESLESGFQQDLNGDGQIGVVATVIETNGSTSLGQVGDQYYLSDSTGANTTLKVFGTDHLANMAGIAGGWTPIAVEKTTTGYEIAWKAVSGNQFTVWNTDSNGNYISDIGVVAGNSSALKSLESGFGQDLNGDGQIGGAISLTQVGDQYHLNDSTGAGPTLKIYGTDHVANMAGIAGAWTPIAVEKTTTGYEIAWKAVSGNQFTVWSTDNNGNYISNTGNIGVVTANSTTLESFENGFHQDLNGDGYIGVVVNGSSGSQTLTAAGGTTALIGGPNDVLNGGAGADTFVFPANFGSNMVNNFTPGTDALQFSQAMFANVAAVLNDAQQVGSNVVITHDPQNVVTLHNTQLSNLHASDIHIV